MTESQRTVTTTELFTWEGKDWALMQRTVTEECVEVAEELPRDIRLEPAHTSPVGEREGQVWDDSAPPGGWVCIECGAPVEDEPCAEHDPALVAEHERAGRMCRYFMGEREHVISDTEECWCKPEVRKVPGK